MLADQIAGALDWWRESGVDCVFADEPRQWVVPAEPPPGTPAATTVRPIEKKLEPAAAAAPESDRSAWPAELAAFAPWWLAEPWLDAGRTQGRVPPRGAAGAPLMLLVPQPESADSDELLGGPQGKLAAAMLAAMGIAPDETYLASALPRHTPAADWAEIGARGFGKVLLHHVELVAPRRVIAFGDTILPLLGHDLPNSAASFIDIEVGGRAIPLLALRSLEGLLARPAWKADAWKKWLAWTR